MSPVATVDLLNKGLEGTGKHVESCDASNRALGTSYCIMGRMPGEKGQVQIRFAYTRVNYGLRYLVAAMCYAGDVDEVRVRQNLVKWGYR